MKDILLEILLTIQGVGAASGLLYQENRITIVSDNSNYLYQYQISEETLKRTRLIDGPYGEAVPKKEKSDFEAITPVGKDLYIFGSGSGQKRNSLIKYSLKKGTKDSLDMSAHFSSLRDRFAIDAGDFNIEGALAIGRELWLFNRGNGPAAKNGIFVLDKNSLAPKGFFPIALPPLQGVATGFTDVTRVDEQIDFIDAAEDSNSSYDDGQRKGTLIGRIDPKSKQLIYTRTISLKNKFEGIACYEKGRKTLDFLLCEDQDNGSSSSDIYRLRIER